MADIRNTGIVSEVPMMREGDDPAAIVSFEMEQMILPRLDGPHVPRFIASGDFSDLRSLTEAKQMMRALIAYHTGGKSLETRKIFMELHEL